MLTTPIFINTIVVFVRLIYFEHEFKGIRSRSKEQSRYRRNFTREMTIASGVDPDLGLFQRIKRTITQDSSHFGINRSKKSHFITPHNRVYTNNTPGPKLDDCRDLEHGYRTSAYAQADPNSVAINPAYKNGDINTNNNNNNDTNVSGSDDTAPRPLHKRAISFNSPVRPSEIRNNAPTQNQPSQNVPAQSQQQQHNTQAPPESGRDIRFVDNLPQPIRTIRQNSIQATDIARSILTLERRDREARAASSKANNTFSGDAPLVIKTLQEVEQEEEERQRRRHKRHNGHNGHHHHHHRNRKMQHLLKTPASMISTSNTADTSVTAVSNGSFAQGNVNDGDEYDYEMDRIYNPERDNTSSDSENEEKKPSQRINFAFSFADSTKKPVSQPTSIQKKSNSAGDTLEPEDPISSFNSSTAVESNDALNSQSTSDSNSSDRPGTNNNGNETKHGDQPQSAQNVTNTPSLAPQELQTSPTGPNTKARAIRIIETPKPSQMLRNSSPKEQKWPSSKPKFLRRFSLGTENEQFNEKYNVQTTGSNSASNTAQDSTNDRRFASPLKALSFPASFGSSNSRSNSVSANLREKQPTDDDPEDMPRLKKIKSHVLSHVAHINSSLSDADETQNGKTSGFGTGLKNMVRAKSLDRANRNSIQRTKSFEKILNEHRHTKDGNGPLNKKEYGDQESQQEVSDFARMAFLRSATAEPDELDSHSLSRAMSSNYLSYQPTVEGNSVFVNLNDDQKEELGGVEYRALKVLAKILVWYYVGWHVLAVVLLLPWGVESTRFRPKFESEGYTPAWWGFFSAASSFNNLGITLTPNSMSSFSSSLYVLIIVPFFMIIGNTGFPVFLRFIIWVMFKISKPYGRMRETLGFLLDHPRRCFTLLFPSGPTWWLFGVLMALNIIDTVLFLILDLNNPYVISIPVGYRIMSGFFQAVATRTTGFGILSIGDLHPAVLVSYTIMMYINVFPVAMSVRHTNVYEEQTLGLYRPPTEVNKEDGMFESGKSKNISEVTTHLMRQLSYDLWFMFISLFIICITEEGMITRGSPAVPIFNVLFEITSAYGTVGLSTGYSGVDMSLSSQFSVIGKLVIIALLYRGRQRSLPYAIDRAIILPTSKMLRNDMAQERAIRNRTISHGRLNRANTGDGGRQFYSAATGYSQTDTLSNRKNKNVMERRSQNGDDRGSDYQNMHRNSGASSSNGSYTTYSSSSLRSSSPDSYNTSPGWNQSNNTFYNSSSNTNTGYGSNNDPRARGDHHVGSRARLNSAENSNENSSNNSARNSTRNSARNSFSSYKSGNGNGDYSNDSVHDVEPSAFYGNQGATSFRNGNNNNNSHVNNVSRMTSRSTASYNGEYGTQYNTEFNAGLHHKHH